MPLTRTITAAMCGLFGLLSSPSAIAQVVNVWSAAPLTSALMFQKGVGADSEGNVYTVSGIRGAVDFGRGPITPPAGDRGLSIAKYEPTGFHLAALGTAFCNDTFIFDMAVDDAGGIYIAGFFEDSSTDFGGGPIPNTNGGSESFVLKYDAFGRFQWVHAYDTGVLSEFRHLAADSAGGVYLFGSQNTGIDFGGGALAAGAFIVKFNSDGLHQWSKTLPGSASQADIAAYESQSVVLTAPFAGDIDLGGGTIMASGSGDFYVVKFSAPTGTHEWSKGFASGTPEAIAVDSSGGIAMTALSSTAIDFGGGPLMNSSPQAIFVANFDTNGDHVWSRVSPTSATLLFARAIAANAFGEVYVAGNTNAPIDLGGGDRSAPFGISGSFMFMAKYDADGAHVWSDAFGSTESISATALDIDDANRIFLGGAYTGIADLGTGPFPDAGTSVVAFVAGFFDTSVPIGGGDCFIATAAYGTPMADELNVFRQVRDRFLLQSGPGTALVNGYYAVSPPIADFIGDHPSLRTATRYALTPIYHYCRAFLAAPWRVTGASVLSAVLFALGGVLVTTRVRRYSRSK